MYINKAIVFGNLTKDPELRALPNGGQVCSFSIATNRTYKKADGTKADEVEFHNIVVFGKTAELCSQYLKKGSSAYVEGHIRTRSWEKDGAKQFRTEVVADSVQFGPRSSASGGETTRATSAAEAPQNSTKEDAIDYPAEDINPDDIPF
ncbi:MAG: single-stranded DNA-binding protein [Pseudolabrys sp.]